MDALRAANLGLRFLLELALLAGVGSWGWEETGWWGAAALPLAFAAIWGVFLSPKARVRLPRGVRLALELTVFALAAAGFFGAGHPRLALAFAVAVAVGEAIHWSATPA
ncbi:MAG TPA: DUF2568 domain-containing protein [Gaiellaceae bacterium]|nr:DUF2568 domain-containing protein [Gaiellaceae bacterium]